MNHQELGSISVHAIVFLHNVELLLDFELVLKVVPSVILVTSRCVKLSLNHLEPKVRLADVFLAHVAIDRPLGLLLLESILELLLIETLLLHGNTVLF